MRYIVASWFAGLFVRTLTRQCIAPTLEADPSLRKMLARAGRWRALSGRLTGQGRGGVQVVRRANVAFPGTLTLLSLPPPRRPNSQATPGIGQEPMLSFFVS